MTNTSFGLWLKEQRLKAGYRSQGQLSRACGIDHSTIARWERDITKPTPENLQKLAPSLKISYEELMEKAGHLTEPLDREIDLLDLLGNEKISITAGDASLTPEQKSEILRAIEKDISNFFQTAPLRDDLMKALAEKQGESPSEYKNKFNKLIQMFPDFNRLPSDILAEVAPLLIDRITLEDNPKGSKKVKVNYRFSSMPESIRLISDLPPVIQRIINKVENLQPDKLQILESVLDSWGEAD